MAVVSRHYNSQPFNIKKEVGKLAIINGTKAAINQFSNLYPKYALKRASVHTWKKESMMKKVMLKNQVNKIS